MKYRDASTITSGTFQKGITETKDSKKRNIDELNFGKVSATCNRESLVSIYAKIIPEIMIKENPMMLKSLNVHNHDVRLLSSIPLRTKRKRKAENIRREIRKNSILL